MILALVGGATTLVQQAIGPGSSLAPEQLWLAAGGIAGALIRAIFVKHQTTLSRETGFDLVIGFMIGILWNLPLFGVWPLFDFAPQSSYLQRAVMVGAVALIGVEIIKRVLIKTAPEFLERRLGAALPQSDEAKKK